MTIQRIVVALAAPRETAAMTTAVDLARTMRLELVGLFVEQVELIALATFPFAREVGFPFPGHRPLDVALMERGLRVQARHAERTLAALLAGAPVRWTFDVVRGRLDASLLAVAGEADLAVVTPPFSGGAGPAALLRAMHAFRAATAPLLLVGEQVQRRASIAIVPPPESDPAALTDVVAALLPRYGHDVLFVEVGSSGPALAAMRADAAKRLAARGVQASVRRAAGPIEAAALLATQSSRLVVLLAETPEPSAAALGSIAWPVLVLPGSAGRTRDRIA